MLSRTPPWEMKLHHGDGILLEFPVDYPLNEGRHDHVVMTYHVPRLDSSLPKTHE
jgi:hypothetical protein